ncbi:MAG: M48 family metallopeptidase [Bacteroidota bacterium]
MKHIRLFLGSLFALILAASSSFSQPSASNQQLVDDVKARLLAVVEPVEGVVWPPKFEIVDRSGEKDSIMGRVIVDGDEQHRKVLVTTALLQHVIQGEADRLAFVMGHELAHIILGHLAIKVSRDATEFRRLVFSREDEYAADLKGMEIALAAGYSHQAALNAFKRLIEMKYEYAPIEGVDHPSFSERLERLDTTSAPLWRAMSSFNNGSSFLQLEQYAAAERCFLNVTKEFPRCYEAWSNLGYVYLMQYCDGLEPRDIKDLGVGHIMVGAFYRRPVTLERAAVKGMDNELWGRAVNALLTALSIKNDLTLAKANLGICYLVAPGGKDVGKATVYLQEAVVAVESDSTVDPIARLAVLVNASVADLSGGRTGQSSQRLDDAEQITEGLGRRALARNSIMGPLLYNRALLFAGSPKSSDKEKAITLLEQFLRAASPASLWWDVGYDLYVKLSTETGKTPKDKRTVQLETEVVYKPILSVSVGEGPELSLSESLAETKGRLGECEIVPVVQGTNLVEMRYPSQGLNIVGTENVLAIRLSGPRAPALSLRLSGIAGPTIAKLHVGMTGQELNKLLGDVDYDMRELVDPDIHYRFYRRIGVAVREKNGKVIEIVIAQIPERAVGM